MASTSPTLAAPDHGTLPKDGSARLRAAELLLELGEFKEAESEVDALLEEEPDDALALSLLGKLKHVKGELSAALACWRRLDEKTPRRLAATEYLASVLRLVAGGGAEGDYVAVGAKLWRKPAHQRELEDVFRELLARRPDAARAMCDRLAARYEHGDREWYKLAVLAKAWIAELAGEPQAACAVLERLGERRSFEADLDRVLMLARLYEGSDDPAQLARAAHIFAQLDGAEIPELKGRFADVCRRLGRRAEAERLARLFAEDFRARHHRPSLRAALDAAEHRYVCLAGLRALFPRAVDIPRGGSRRRRALALAVAGQLSAARALFVKSGQALDTKYLVELALSRGSEDEAAALFLQALRDEAVDGQLLGAVLDQAGAAKSRELTRVFRRPEIGVQCLDVLRSAVRSAPLRPERWRRLETLLSMLGQGQEAAQCGERASLLEQAARDGGRPVGRVLAAAICHFAGSARGLIHEIWAERIRREPGTGGALGEILGSLTPQMRDEVRNTFVSVREYARAKLPHRTADVLDYDYRYKVTKEDEPSSGASASLPTALAFLSVFLSRPVPQDMASSGVLVADAHDVLVLRGVGEAEHKVGGAYNRNLRTLILPQENRPQLERGTSVPRSIGDQLVRYAATLDEAVSLTFGEDVWVE
jgi:tetratricopeptide (TPR) repeat protein